jgi:hypothetical protein
MMDLVTYTYIILTIVSLYSFIVFAILWYKEKYIPELYAYCTFLMLGISVSTILELYSRLIRFSDYSDFLELVNSHFWFDRLLIKLICIFLVAFHVTVRTFFWERPITKDRRKTDK